MLCYNQKTAEGDKRFLLENRNYEKNRATVIYVPFLAHKRWYNISTPKPKRTGEKKMKAFEKIIGYEKIKDELKQICDIVQNRDIYKKMGANMPNGILINGAPGLGKSLMAHTLIEACGINSYILRRTKGDGDFIREIERVFTEAQQNAPSIILLDDLDKFPCQDGSQEELSAVQAWIDKVKCDDVFIIATANDLGDIPKSLIRSGRFDRRIVVEAPSIDDATKIIEHYLKGKPIVADVNIDDVAKMLAGDSCATLEATINDAAVYAAYERCEKVEMRHLVMATLRENYHIRSLNELTEDELTEVAYHEAGHAVISELILEGSVGMVSISAHCGSDRIGFVRKCKEHRRRAHIILTILGGKAGAELTLGRVASGAQNDLYRAQAHIKDAITDSGTMGNHVLGCGYSDTSERSQHESELLTRAKLDEYLFKAKEMLCKNRGFYEAVARALLERKTLLASDIARIRSEHSIVKVDIA